MKANLYRELAHHQYLRERLVEDFPDADEECLRDTLEARDIPAHVDEEVDAPLPDGCPTCLSVSTFIDGTLIKEIEVLRGSS